LFRETAWWGGFGREGFGGQVAKMVPRRSCRVRRKRFAGKTVLSKRTAIPAFQEEPGTIKVKINEPLKVEDVIAGISADEPIWLVVSTAEGSKGYIAIAYSLTNVHPGIWMTARPWEAVLFEEDPRTLYAWDEQPGRLINDGVAKDGDGARQVRLRGDAAERCPGRRGRDVVLSGQNMKFHPAGPVSYPEPVRKSLRGLSAGSRHVGAHYQHRGLSFRYPAGGAVSSMIRAKKGFRQMAGNSFFSGGVTDDGEGTAARLHGGVVRALQPIRSGRSRPSAGV
jgi:hypothetical protein